MRKFCDVRENLVAANISHREQVFLMLRLSWTQKLLTANQFNTQKSRNKIVASKSWYTVPCKISDTIASRELQFYKHTFRAEIMTIEHSFVTRVVCFAMSFCIGVQTVSFTGTITELATNPTCRCHSKYSNLSLQKQNIFANLKLKNEIKKKKNFINSFGFIILKIEYTLCKCPWSCRKLCRSHSQRL